VLPDLELEWHLEVLTLLLLLRVQCVPESLFALQEFGFEFAFRHRLECGALLQLAQCLIGFLELEGDGIAHELQLKLEASLVEGLGGDVCVYVLRDVLQREFVFPFDLVQAVDVDPLPHGLAEAFDVVVVLQQVHVLQGLLHEPVLTLRRDEPLKP